MQSLAELGFVVVCLDGLGTAGRSKAFHDALYGDLADNTVPDQVAGIKELAAKYAWIDAERVGTVSYTHLDVYKRQVRSLTSKID